LPFTDSTVDPKCFFPSSEVNKDLSLFSEFLQIFEVLILCLISLGRGETESTWFIGPILPAQDDDDDESGAVGGMSGKENRSTRINPASVPLCPPQNPNDLIRAETQAAAVGKHLLTA
jgi:hypothetical protein